MTYKEGADYLHDLVKKVDVDPDDAKKEFIVLLTKMGVMYPPSRINDDLENWE